ncbi:MAG: DNA-binding protein [Elusimicrobia bacterium GWA2_69_24]|nr:MAG: DNA-binding protein [Elusimicrobia bacterium GWA2_69_24]HBL18764.1 DNA-binding protein [Elusimicrobiota bacterium]
MEDFVSLEEVEESISYIRGRRVMLDRDLANLYGVPAKALNRAVKRNLERFPLDFMFQLTAVEWADLKRQNGTSSWGGDRRALPHAFTEQGVAMLSSVLRSRRAVQVNIQIMRAFVRLRRILTSHKGLSRRFDELEKRHEGKFRVVFDAIRRLMAEPDKVRPQIGFKP